MYNIFSLDPGMSILEKLIRSGVVYIFLLIAFRLTGKRQVGQMTTFDLVVVLIISNVLQNAMIGADNSVFGGLIGASVILVLNFLIAEIAFRSRKFEHFIEPVPTILIVNGKIVKKNLRRELISLDDLHAALRKEGVLAPEHVKLAVLEANGSISIVRKEEVK